MKFPLCRLTLLVGCSILSGCASGRGDRFSANDAAPIEVDLVNDNATFETRSLFAYLKTNASHGILFGHQNSTTQGLTISSSDGSQSDVYNAVGDFPAIYGWGSHTVVEPKRGGDVTAQIRMAYARGGIITFFTLWDNPMTYDDPPSDTNSRAGSTWDRTPAVAASLPGGEANDVYRGWLDEFADWALTLTDENGRPIPIIFRVLIEHTGNWFWWGEAQCTPEEYKQLFRYTVDYLTHERGVNNLLFAYSPSTHDGPHPEIYLERYPGDEYVDVLAFDAYGPVSDNEEWFKSQVVEYSAMVVRLAEERGKIPAIGEVGLSFADIEKGLYDDRWYRKLIEGLKADPEARRIAYLLVWRNGSPTHYWVPTTLPDHVENGTLRDFRAFYADPETLFNAELRDVYTLPTVEKDR